ncbi:MAG: deoxyribodipyrimidine photo-lyase [Actinomycetota bacterium]|nr:deoxyribodipyrimidine photo-lyase [Actinomycetota bacterium]
MSVAVVLFTRDLRVHDNPTLSAALSSSDTVVPLFVLDEAILGGFFNRPNRARFLVDALRDLDTSLRERGARLVIRRGDVVDEVVGVAREVGADVVHMSADASGYARRRQAALAARLEADNRSLETHDETLFVVPPGVITPGGGDHMAVFTPFHRRWEKRPVRDLAPTPRRVPMSALPAGRIPAADLLCRGAASPDLASGGEAPARERLSTWLAADIATYDDAHDAVADDATSRLSPYLHFGCLSPVEVVHRARRQGWPGADAFVRQLAWRDFHAQVLAARPDATHRDYRSRGDRWHRSHEELEAWREGRTGFPIVDAGMRQLAREGWMHNRTRLITAHFLTKTLYIDWRLGAAHFIDLLVDGDVANNTMNWQWCAGTGTDSRFNRSYNVTTQARRHDPRGIYVRRYVPELADVDDAYVHEPWLLPEEQRQALGYPPPLVDQDEARDRLRRARAKPGR